MTDVTRLDGYRTWRPDQEAVDAPDDEAYRDSLGSPTKAQRFDLVPFSAITFSEGARWLVKGLLPAEGLAVIYGPPKSYKSFIAADVALHVASGRDWAGRRVRQGAVVYIVGEGSTGFADRIAANRQERGLPSDLPFYLIKARPNLGVGEGDTQALVAAIAGVLEPVGIPVAAIFIDTLVRTLAGSSENDEGMRNFTDNAEALADRFHCLAVAVHHTGKATDKGMRGSSALHGAVVTSWLVEKPNPSKFEARITLDNAKDGDSGLVWTAELERFVFRTDEDGDEESVLLVRDVGMPRAEKASVSSATSVAKIPPASLRLFLDCLTEALGATGQTIKPFTDGPIIQAASHDAVRSLYLKRRAIGAPDDDPSKVADANRKAFSDAKKRGLDQKLFSIQPVGGEMMIWPLSRSGTSAC